jgi:hypothetical protein
MTEEEAKKMLHDMWESGELPENFTEDHSEYSTAVEHLMKFGEILYEDILW